MKVIEWIPAETPPHPDNPYGWYMVWLRGTKGRIRDGIPDFAQYSANEEQWIVRPHYNDLVVTHWAVAPTPPNDDTGFDESEVSNGPQNNTNLC